MNKTKVKTKKKIVTVKKKDLTKSKKKKDPDVFKVPEAAMLHISASTHNFPIGKLQVGGWEKEMAKNLSTPSIFARLAGDVTKAPPEPRKERDITYDANTYVKSKMETMSPMDLVRLNPEQWMDYVWEYVTNTNPVGNDIAVYHAPFKLSEMPPVIRGGSSLKIIWKKPSFVDELDKSEMFPELYNVGVIEQEDLSYEFNMLCVWAHKSGRLYWAQSSGCSCPTPFEEYHFNSPDRHDLREIKEYNMFDFTSEVSNFPASAGDRMELLGKVSNILREIKKEKGDGDDNV